MCVGLIPHGMLKTFPFKRTIISGSSFIDEKGDIKNKKKRFHFDKDSYRYVVGPDTGTVMLCVKCGKVNIKAVLKY